MEKLTVWVLEELDKRGWKPADLAHRAGLSTGSLSNILNGNRKAGPDVCRAIADALGEPEEKVFRLAGLLSPLPATEDSPTLQEIIDLAKRMTPEQREQAADYIRFLYQKEQEEKRAQGGTNESPVESGV